MARSSQACLCCLGTQVHLGQRLTAHVRQNRRFQDGLRGKLVPPVRHQDGRARCSQDFKFGPFDIPVRGDGSHLDHAKAPAAGLADGADPLRLGQGIGPQLTCGQDDALARHALLLPVSPHHVAAAGGDGYRCGSDGTDRHQAEHLGHGFLLRGAATRGYPDAHFSTYSRYRWGKKTGPTSATPLTVDCLYPISAGDLEERTGCLSPPEGAVEP